MHQPLVSILIITYNQHDFIHETLTSALNQDYDNLEIVVSDDASTDGTAEVIMHYAAKCPVRLVPITGGPRLGITGNSNRALKACKGKYIAFQGGDDVYLQGKISAQVSWMEADDRRVHCSHDVEVFESTSGKKLYLWNDVYRLRNGIGLREALKFGAPSLGPGTSIMVRSASMPKSGFDDRIPVASDVKFIFDCIGSQGHFGFIDGVYAKYRRHEKNITTTGKPELIKDGEMIIQLLQQDYPNFKREICYVQALHFFTVFVWQVRDEQYVSARKNLLQALKYNPISLWKIVPLYIYTFFPSPLPDVLMTASSTAFRIIKRRVLQFKTTMKLARWFHC